MTAGRRPRRNFGLTLTDAQEENPLTVAADLCQKGHLFDIHTTVARVHVSITTLERRESAMKKS